MQQIQAGSVSDINMRPFRNVAEIIGDGADLYDQDGIDVEDIDSMPDPTRDPANDGPVDNTDIGEAGDGDDGPLGDQPGHDDADPAVLDGDVVYDLALIKRLPAGQRFKVGDVIRFEIVVANQGNVLSGPYSVQDVLPAGLSFVAATDGGTASAGTVTWAGLPSLALGEQKLLTVEVRMDDPGQPSYVNVAEVTDDSSENYSTPNDPVIDRDSGPDINPGNDPYVDTDDIGLSTPDDEDDHDRALLDPAEVAFDNQAPPPPPAQLTSPPTASPDLGELSAIGGNSNGTIWIAGGLLLAGAALIFIDR